MCTPEIKLEHQDSRGEIYSISLPDGHELMLVHSTPGAFRGGHSHSCGELVMMLVGYMQYHKDEDNDLTLFSPGSISFNSPGQVHMGEFLEDSWLIEYKLAKKGEWTQEDYPPMRENVRANIK